MATVYGGIIQVDLNQGNWPPSRGASQVGDEFRMGRTGLQEPVLESAPAPPVSRRCSPLQWPSPRSEMRPRPGATWAGTVLHGSLICGTWPGTILD